MPVVLSRSISLHQAQLISHLDVVPATESDWICPPFKGDKHVVNRCSFAVYLTPLQRYKAAFGTATPTDEAHWMLNTQ